MIQPSDIQSLISLGENDKLEFKSNFNNEVIATLVAFANTSGGMILIGVSPTGKILGVSGNAESIQNWVNEIKSKTTPSLIPEVSSVNIEEKAVLVLSIKEYPVKPVATRGKYFKRVTNSNHLLDISDVVNLHLQSFNTSWDFHLNSQFSINELSINKVQEAIDIINRTGIRINDDPLTFW